jgi:hypothetical protein
MTIKTSLKISAIIILVFALGATLFYIRERSIKFNEQRALVANLNAQYQERTDRLIRENPFGALLTMNFSMRAEALSYGVLQVKMTLPALLADRILTSPEVGSDKLSGTSENKQRLITAGFHTIRLVVNGETREISLVN